MIYGRQLNNDIDRMTSLFLATRHRHHLRWEQHHNYVIEKCPQFVFLIDLPITYMDYFLFLFFIVTVRNIIILIGFSTLVPRIINI